jgi:hypothetical protein
MPHTETISCFETAARGRWRLRRERNVQRDRVELWWLLVAIMVPTGCRYRSPTGRPLASGCRHTRARLRLAFHGRPSKTTSTRSYTTSGDATRCPTGPNALRPWGAHCSGTGEPRRESRNAGLRLRGGTTPPPPAERLRTRDSYRAGVPPRRGLSHPRGEQSRRYAVRPP